jgi:DNA mismatch repair ATPase MutL
VENLFFNVPARLKFLKSDTTERGQIDTLVTRYALAYPQVRFHLKQEARPAFQTSGNGDQREVLAAVYGLDIARQMLEVQSPGGRINQVTGFISPLSLTRSNRREIVFFVNGRPVQDASLSAASGAGLSQHVNGRALPSGCALPGATPGHRRCERPPSESRGPLPGERPGLRRGAASSAEGSTWPTAQYHV